MNTRALRRRFLVFAFAALWIAALIPTTVGFARTFVVERHFVRLARRNVRVPGIDDAALERSLVDAFVVPRFLRAVGYDFQFRTALHQELAVAISSERPEQIQLILREEVADEFGGPRAEAVFDSAATYIADTVRAEATREASRVAVLLVPPKIIANDIDTSLATPNLLARKRLGLDARSRRVGVVTNLHRVEGRLESLGIATLPVTQAVRAVGDAPGGYPPYPFGESHWNRRVVLEVARASVRRLVTLGFVPERCVAERDTSDVWRRVATESYGGDLFEMAQLDWQYGAGRGLRTNVPTDVTESLGRPESDASCPDLLLVGSSYSDMYRDDGDLGEALGVFYRGTVTNRGAPGRTPRHVWRLLDRAGISDGSVIIWEIPFRFVKFLGRER